MVNAYRAAQELRLCEEAQATGYRIAKSSAKFKAATLAEKRVIIAKDVIAQVNAGKINAVSGNVYLDDVADFSQPAESCTACALGAMFACAVPRLGLYSNRLIFDSFEMCEKLTPIFDKKQLRLMEKYFEEDWVRDIKDDADRLIAIMKNVVVNHGTFKP